MLRTQNPSTASRTPTTAIVVKIWTIQADQVAGHHPTRKNKKQDKKNANNSGTFNHYTAHSMQHPVTASLTLNSGLNCFTALTTTVA